MGPAASHWQVEDVLTMTISTTSSSQAFDRDMPVVESPAADGLTYASVPGSTLSIGRLYTGQDDGSRRVVDHYSLVVV